MQYPTKPNQISKRKPNQISKRININCSCNIFINLLLLLYTVSIQFSENLGMNNKTKLVSSVQDDNAVALLRDLVAAQPKGENAVQEMISDRLARAGCEVSSVDYEPRTVPVIGELIVEGTRNVGAQRAILYDDFFHKLLHIG